MARPVLAAIGRMLDGDEGGLSSGVKSGPHISAPTGTRKKSLEVARASPSVSTAQRPSVRPVALLLLPSVETQSRPAESTAQLSGMPNQPFLVVSVEKVAPTAATEGSPHFRSTSHLPEVAVKSPSASAISIMWPKAFSARGLAAFTWSTLRRVLLVSIT
jgi:hypothetical protein